MKVITILTTEHKKGADRSQIFLNERLAALNSENLLNFWEKINKEDQNIGLLQAICEKERSYLKEIGMDEQTIYRRMNTRGTTSEHWPHHIMKEALKINNGINLSNL
ncbi:MAG: hypothetical protein MTP17_01165 [Candidatus Midichloria sp.]|nr:MAG: hypothetical protein MTP17_01165 [Candidatus Midichloria sp.]